MIKKEINFRKKREVGDIITDSFAFLKQEFKPLLNLIIIYVLPFLILYSVVEVYFEMKVLSHIDLTNTENLMSNLEPFYINFLLFSIFGLFVQSLLVGTFYSFVEVYVNKGKGNFELSEIKPRLFSNGLKALKAGLTMYIISLMGLKI